MPSSLRLARTTKALVLALALVCGLLLHSPSTAQAARKGPSVSVSSYSNNAVRLTWKKVKSAASYQVQYSTSSKFTSAQTVPATGTSAVIGGLAASKKYYFKVRALKANGSALTSFGKAKKVTTRSKKSYSELSPTGLAQRGNWGDQVDLAWTAQGSTNRYRVNWSTKSSMSKAKSVYVTGTSASIAKLSKSKTYYFTVQTASGNKTISQASSKLKVKTAKKISYGKLTASISRVDPTAFLVSWQSTRKAPAYEVAYSGTGWADSASVVTTGTSITLRGLLANTDYQVKVRALDSTNQAVGSFSAITRATTPSGDANLRLASYNVMCHTCAPKSTSSAIVSQPWTVRRDWVVANISEAAPDVIALQEAQQSKLTSAGDTDLSQFDDLLKRLGEGWALTNTNRYNCTKTTTAESSSSCKPKDQGASLGVRIAYKIDKVKLLSQGSLKLPTALADGSSAALSANQRYMAWAFMQQLSTGKKFLMVDVHLESRNDGQDTGCDAATVVCGRLRQAQAQAITAKIGALNVEGLPVVVAGDLSSSRSELGGNLPYPVFTSMGLVNPLGGTDVYIDPAQVPANTRINIVYNSVNQLERTPRRYGSDQSKNNTYNGPYNDYILTSPMTVSDFEQQVHVTGDGAYADQQFGSDHNLIRTTVRLP